MDVYYQKLMGNGTLASKFKLGAKAPHPSQQPLPLPSEQATPGMAHSQAATAPAQTSAAQKPPGVVETPASHHELNCERCYRLKKKCSRNYPRCDYCVRSNTQCEYVNRKRKKLSDELAQAPAPAFASFAAGGARSPPGNPLHIASLVNHRENEQTFRNIDLPSALPGLAPLHSVQLPKLKLGAPPVAAKPALMLVPQRLVAMSASTRSQPNLQDEFLVVKPIADVNLPSAFVHTFFANFEWRYPFISRSIYLGKLEPHDFTQETMVNLDVYLVMAMGCQVFDASHGTEHFAEFFSHTLIESIVDILNYDIRLEKDLHKAHLLLLLCVYANSVGNTGLLWNLLGFLNRLVIFLTDFNGCTRVCMRKRCFWTVYNMDKELSLVLGKFSQFMPLASLNMLDDFCDVLEESESQSLGSLMSLWVQFHKLQDRMLRFKLRLEPPTAESLTTFSADVEAWRVAILLKIHTVYAELALLQNFIGMVHLDYYYLLIELDQMSSTRLSQFTLQFLSNSFSLLLSEQGDKKDAPGITIYSLFWFRKFFKVIDYTLCLLELILSDHANRAAVSVSISEFKSNGQLIINLLKYLLSSKARPTSFAPQLEKYQERLTALCNKIMSFDALTAEDKDYETLAAHVKVTLVDVTLTTW